MPYQRASGCRLLKEATSGDIVLKRCIHFRVQNQQMLTLFLSYKMHLDHMQSLKCSSLLIPLPVSSLWSWRRWALRAHPWVGRWTENWALQKAHPPRGRALHAVLCCCTGTKTMGKAQTGHKDLEHLGVLLWSEIGVLAWGYVGLWIIPQLDLMSNMEHLLGWTPPATSYTRRLLLARDTKWRGKSFRKFFILGVHGRAMNSPVHAHDLIWTWKRLNINANFRTIILKAWLRIQSEYGNYMQKLSFSANVDTCSKPLLLTSFLCWIFSWDLKKIRAPNSNFLLYVLYFLKLS